jgi:hypothetical protein
VFLYPDIMYLDFYRADPRKIVGHLERGIEALRRGLRVAAK